MIASADQMLGGRMEAMIKVTSVKVKMLRQSVLGIFQLGIWAVTDSMHACISAFLSDRRVKQVGKGAPKQGIYLPPETRRNFYSPLCPHHVWRKRVVWYANKGENLNCFIQKKRVGDLIKLSFYVEINLNYKVIVLVYQYLSIAQILFVVIYYAVFT